jgi:LuxR family maltose regulon positive regulatory protein
MLWAARIIEQHFDLVHRIRGEAATIDRWLSVLPAEVVRSRPRLLLAQAHMAADSGHPEVVEPLLDAVDCAPPGWADEPFEPASSVSRLIMLVLLVGCFRLIPDREEPLSCPGRRIMSSP